MNLESKINSARTSMGLCFGIAAFSGILGAYELYNFPQPPLPGLSILLWFGVSIGSCYEGLRYKKEIKSLKERE